MRLLPGRRGVVAAVLLAGCVLLTVVLGVLFAGHGQPGALDTVLDRAVDHTIGRHPGMMSWLDTLGTLKPVALLTVALVLACVLLRWWNCAVLAAVAVPLASLVTEQVLKPLVSRSLRGFLSFPSGHATSMFAVAVVLAIVLAQPGARRIPLAVRLVAAVAMLLLAAAVGLAMVGLGFHYVTDVAGGAAVGTAVPLGCALLLDRICGLP